MRFYDITIRVSADAVRAAQASPEDPPLMPHEAITTEHLAVLGEILTDTVRDTADSYIDDTARISSVAGPLNVLGGQIHGVTGPLAEIDRLKNELHAQTQRSLETERELDRVLEALVGNAPACWAKFGDSLEDVALQYLNVLELGIQPDGTHHLGVDRHRMSCDGECSK